MGLFIKGEPSKGVTFKKGQTPWNKGKKMTEEYCKKVGDVQRGKTLTDGHKANISAGLFKGSLERKGLLYQVWLKSVLKRDDYNCQICDAKDRIVAHHIVDYKNPDGSKNKELMLDIDNGLALCSPCHIKLHNEQDKFGFIKGFTPWNKGTKGLTGWVKGKKRNNIPWNKGTKGISGGWETRRKKQEERLKEINNIKNE